MEMATLALSINPGQDNGFLSYKKSNTIPFFSSPDLGEPGMLIKKIKFSIFYFLSLPLFLALFLLKGCIPCSRLGRRMLA